MMRYKNPLYYLIVILALVSCGENKSFKSGQQSKEVDTSFQNKGLKNASQNLTNNRRDSVPQINQGLLNHISCDSLLSLLVMTSSLEHDLKKGVKVKVNDVIDGVLKIKIVSENEHNIDVPIGWIDFDVKKKTLLDVSPYHENPINLTYDRSVLKKITKYCKIVE